MIVFNKIFLLIGIILLICSAIWGTIGWRYSNAYNSLLIVIGIVYIALSFKKKES